MGYICENTLSRKGHHQWAGWLGGFTTRSWYQKSPLEQFLEIEAPDIIEYRWTSSKGTGKNIFGLTQGVRAHGMPGNALKINHDDLKRWMELNDSQTIRNIYESLRSGDQETIIQMIDRIYDDLIRDIVLTK